MPGPVQDEVASAYGGPVTSHAHGQAAILLVESLIHGLIARSIITVDEAVEIVGNAVEVRADVAHEMGLAADIGEEVLAVLQSIHASLSIDLPTEAVSSWSPKTNG